MLNKITNTAADILKGVAGAVASQSNTYNPQQEYRNAEKVSQMYSDAINTQYAAGIQNLMDQKKAIPLQYDPQRASVNTNYERGVRNNAEQMANLGLERSGTNLTSQIALETERQRGLAEVNAAQDEATRNLRAQINEYIAQRDSAIAQQRAGTYENAYNNISAYQRQLAQMEKQQQFDKEMAAISHTYNQQMATLQHEYDIALANNNHEKQAALQREMAALEQQYKIETLNKQAELDMQVYDKKAATDWGYYQKQANLDSSLAKSEYNSKVATDWEYAQKSAAIEKESTTDPLSAKYKLQTDVGKNIYNYQIKNGWKPGKKLSDFEASAQKVSLDFALNTGVINESDYGYLIRILGL